MALSTNDLEISLDEGSVIAPDMRITGTVVSKGSIVCAGQLEGNVNCETFKILQTGKLTGDIHAKSVIVNGSVIGNIVATRVQLEENANFIGELCCTGLAVDPGAKFEAKCKREKAKNG